MILPLILALVLYEKVGLHIGICIPIFLVLSAAAAFAVYLEGAVSIIIEILSFVVSVPLFLFLVLAYGFNMETLTALKVAVGVPLLIVVVIAVLAERKQ